MSAPGHDTDARTVAAIRAILAEFDWETGDRQSALEAIEQIIEQIAPAPADVCEHGEAGPLAGMKGSEVGRRYLDGRSRIGLEGLLLFISGYRPAAFLAAVSAAGARAEDDAGRAIAAGPGEQRGDGCPVSAPRPELDALQRYSVEQAREMIARTPEEILAAEHPDLGPGSAYAYAYGRLRPHVKDLLEIVDELTSVTSAGDDAGRAIAADPGEQRGDGCPETSDGYHCGHWYEGGKCCACGQTGPEADEDGAS